MDNKEILIQSISAVTPEELFDVLHELGAKDIENLLGLSIMIRAAINMVQGGRNVN